MDVQAGQDKANGFERWSMLVVWQCQTHRVDLNVIATLAVRDVGAGVLLGACGCHGDLGVSWVMVPDFRDPTAKTNGRYISESSGEQCAGARCRNPESVQEGQLLLSRVPGCCPVQVPSLDAALSGAGAALLR
jgi:hypothetical protein